MGHMLCFCPMGLTASPATVLRGGEDSLPYRLQLRFTGGPSGVKISQIFADADLTFLVR